jgi:hypothetical protein
MAVGRWCHGVRSGLGTAVRRAQARHNAGISEDEAKSDISGAIADKEIKGVRLTVVVTDVLMPYHQMVAKVQGLGSDPKYSASTVECFEGMMSKFRTT